MLLLVIDQEARSVDLLVHRLTRQGFVPSVVASTAFALAGPLRDSAAAVLLNQGRSAPPADEAVAALRAGGVDLPLIVLSERDDWRERVAVLEAGADDVLVKPVRSEEVAARIRAAVQRRAGVSSAQVVIGDLDLDLNAHCAWLNGLCLDLTRNEFRLLQLLALAPGTFASKNRIIGAIWPNDRDISGNAVEVLVTRLRQKIGAHRIQTVRGTGYRLQSVETDDGRPRERTDDCRGSCASDDPG